MSGDIYGKPPAGLRAMGQMRVELEMISREKFLDALRLRRDAEGSV